MTKKQSEHSSHDAEEKVSEQAAEAGRKAGEEAEHIAAEGEHVRERVRKLVVQTIEQRHLSFEELNHVAKDVLEGAASGVKQATPKEKESVLRAVIDGLADSYNIAANATKLALEEANGKRKTFAEEDLKRIVRELRVLDERFIRMVSHTTKRTWGMMTDETATLRDHVERAAKSIRPSMESALREAGSHPIDLANESASAGIKATRQTAGVLLQAVSGLLQGASDVLTRESDKADAPTKGKSGKKKKG